MPAIFRRADVLLVVKQSGADRYQRATEVRSVPPVSFPVTSRSLQTASRIPIRSEKKEKITKDA
jgi:hypothetical protein